MSNEGKKVAGFEILVPDGKGGWRTQGRSETGAALSDIEALFGRTVARDVGNHYAWSKSQPDASFREAMRAIGQRLDRSHVLRAIADGRKVVSTRWHHRRQVILPVVDEPLGPVCRPPRIRREKRG